jgi:hypothetical protein
MRQAARMHGYAIALHGSVSRDIDLIAIPWTETADSPDLLLQAICGAVAGSLGTCRPLCNHGDDGGLWTSKPHCRQVVTLLAFVGGTSIDFDFGVMPRITKEPE